MAAFVSSRDLQPPWQQTARPPHWFPQLLILMMATLACQAPDITYEGVKLSELFAILAFPLILTRLRHTPKVFVRFLFSIILIAFITLVHNQFIVFYEPLGVGLLRKPNLITVCRVISFTCCLTTAVLFHRACLVWPGFLARFLSCQAYMALIFFGFWCLSRVGPDFFIGEGDRLVGLYNEGGPFGLMMAFFFCVAMSLQSPTWMKVVFALCVLGAESKAGIMLIVLGPALVLAPRLSKTARIIVAAAVLASVPFVLSKIAGNYLREIADLENMLRTRWDDPNFVMGRVAGLHILPEMFLHNPLIGTGLGNYSLVRNNPLYRGVFPEVDQWDLSGLGGIATMFAEGGIVGVALCFLPLLILFRQASPVGRGPLLATCLSLCLGVQFYFAYPWIGVAIASLPNLKSFRNSSPLSNA